MAFNFSTEWYFSVSLMELTFFFFLTTVIIPSVVFPMFHPFSSLPPQTNLKKYFYFFYLIKFASLTIPHSSFLIPHLSEAIYSTLDSRLSTNTHSSSVCGVLLQAHESSSSFACLEDTQSLRSQWCDSWCCQVGHTTQTDRPSCR